MGVHRVSRFVAPLHLPCDHPEFQEACSPCSNSCAHTSACFHQQRSHQSSSLLPTPCPSRTSTRTSPPAPTQTSTRSCSTPSPAIPGSSVAPSRRTHLPPSPPCSATRGRAGELMPDSPSGDCSKHGVNKGSENGVNKGHKQGVNKGERRSQTQREQRGHKHSHRGIKSSIARSATLFIPPPSLFTH